MSVSDLAFPLFVASLRIIPEDPQIPENYWISTYARHALSGNRHIVSTTPEESTGVMNVTWPLRKIFGTFTELWDYAVDRPLIAGVYVIEKALRGDFHSAVILAQENVRSLKEHNVVYDDQLKKLEPITELMVELVKTSLSISEGLQAEITETEITRAQLQREVEEITAARKEIDLESVRDAAEKVASYVKTHLTDEAFIEKLKLNDERFQRAQQQLDAALVKLETAQEKYEENLRTLEALWSEYEDLGVEQTAQVKLLQSQVEQLIRKHTSTPLVTHGYHVEVNV